MNKIIGLVIVGALASSVGLPMMAVTKIVPMPWPKNITLSRQARPDELIELNDYGMYTRAPFVKLIQNKQKSGLPFIMARVITRIKNADIVHYCEAHAVNQVYGQYPFIQEYDTRSKENPINRASIQRIDYFMISYLDTPAFEYLCSDFELLRTAENPTLYKDIFYLNAEGGGAPLGQQAALRLGRRLAEHEPMSAQVSLGVNYTLGIMYFVGKGVDKNYVKARDYLRQVADQRAAPEVELKTKWVLGMIYEINSPDYGLVQDLQRARAYYTRVANQTVLLPLANDARARLSSLDSLATMRASQAGESSRQDSAKKQKMNENDK